MIATLSQWWAEMEALNQAFYIAAMFFSVIFLWQFIASLIGIGGGDADAEVDVDADVDVDAGVDIDADADIDGDLDHAEAMAASDAVSTLQAFRLLSLRAILAFCMLFFWAGALYLDSGQSTTISLLYATGWGGLAWGVITVLINLLYRLTETGTARISTSVGTAGSVYMDIPADGLGKVRTVVSGRMTMVDARAAGRIAIQAGTPVRVVRMLDRSTVEVAVVKSAESERNDQE